MSASLLRALADALCEMGWDGQRSAMNIEVRSGDLSLGRIEINVLPFDAVIVGQESYRVTRKSFTEALRGSAPAQTAEQQLAGLKAVCDEMAALAPKIGTR